MGNERKKKEEKKTKKEEETRNHLCVEWAWVSLTLIFLHILASGLQRWSLSHLPLGHIITSHYTLYFYILN